MKRTLRDENGVCYVIKKKLGSGGQGVTYLTTDPSIIIKVQNPHVGDSIDVCIRRYEQFRRQIDRVRALMLTSDIHIAEPVYMLKKPICGYVMKFMSGMVSLNKLVMDFQNASTVEKSDYYKKSGGLLRRLKLLREVAVILFKLRERSLVYADLSYNNVFVSEKTEDCRAWLIDADNLCYNGELGMSFGTPECWAPEVASGTENSIYSDIYSFAILSHTFLTGQKPFCGRIFVNNLIDYDEDHRAATAVVEDDWGDDEDDYSAAPTEIEDDWGDDDDDPVAAENDDGKEKDGFPKDPQNNDISVMMDRGMIPWIDDPDNRDNENPVFGLREAVINRRSALFDCFNRTFCREGRKNPLSRPTPHEWISAIDESIRRIVVCECGWSYYRSESACPMCSKKRPPIYVATVIERIYDDCGELVAEKNAADLTVSFDSETELIASMIQPTALSKIIDNDPAMLKISNKDGEWIIDGMENMKCRILDKSKGERRIYEYEPRKRYVFKNLEDAVISVVCNGRLRKISFKREG